MRRITAALRAEDGQATLSFEIVAVITMTWLVFALTFFDIDFAGHFHGLASSVDTLLERWS